MVRASLRLALALALVGCGGRTRAADGLRVSARALGAGGGSGATAPGTSPLEKFLAGDRAFGVFPVHQPPCDRAAWAATAEALGAEGTILEPDAGVPGATVSVGAVTTGVVTDLARVWTALRDGGGTDLDGQHVCVVPTPGVGPGLSTSNGFIAFDPVELLAMNQLVPDGERTMYSQPVAMAHELAHQLQYRYGDPFAGDKTVRHTELAADCMGTAFVAMLQPEGWIMDEVGKGAVGALQAYADVKFRSTLHHGTRADRARMAEDGLGLVAGARRQRRRLDLATLKTGCELAVRGWDASMPLTPPDQLWGGTEP